jgi:hypothetical protein
LAKSTNYEAPHYAVPSNLPSLPFLRSKYPPQHHVVKPDSLCFSLNVRDQVSHPYRTTKNIIVLYLVIFMFFGQQRRRQKVLD